MIGEFPPLAPRPLDDAELFDLDKVKHERPRPPFSGVEREIAKALGFPVVEAEVALPSKDEGEEDNEASSS